MNARETTTHAIATLLGRGLLGAIFVWAGSGKIGGFDATVARIAATGLPMANIAAIATIIFEIGAGLLLISGVQTRWVALALAVFTLLTGFLFHNFWAVPATQLVNQQVHFFKNLAIAGGLLFVFANGAGRLSVSRH